MNQESKTFIDALLKRLELKNDLALAKQLGYSAAVVSRIRRGHTAGKVSDSFILRLHERAGLPVADIRAMM